MSTNSMAASTETTEVAKKSAFWEWVRFIIFIAIAYFVLTHTIGLTKVSGNSMNPSLSDGSIVLVNKLSNYVGNPKYGDVVIIHDAGIGYDIIKRVIAVGGDTVSITNGTVYVNRVPLPELYTTGQANDMKETFVEANKIFVVGDNRTPGESLDSREARIGTIPVQEISGYAIVSLAPFYKIAKPLKL
jgi:signal peptidase I